jgi:hypothetical protein
MADDYFLLAEGSTIMGTHYDLEPKWQENRFGPTVRNIKRRIPFAGMDASGTGVGSAGTNAAMMIEMNPQIMTNARSGSDLEAVMPDATTMAGMMVGVNQSDMRRVAASLALSKLALDHYRGMPDASWNLAKEMRRQTDKAIAERQDQIINTSTGAKGTVANVYAPGGTSAYSSAGYAWIQLSTSPSMFHQGELITITQSSNTVSAVVVAVCHAPQFERLNIGPGIMVYASTDTYLSSVTAGDTIYPAGETPSTSGYPCSMPALFNSSTTPGAFFDKTRYGTTNWVNNFLVPYMEYCGDASAPVPFDIDVHFGHMFATLAQMIPTERNNLAPQKGEENIEISDAVITEASPAMVREISRQAGQPGSRWTRALPSTLGEAGKKIIAVCGTTATVLIDPDMPPIVLQSNELMTPTNVRTWDPNQWAMIEMGGGKPEWLKDPGSGSVWHQAYNITSAGSVASTTTLHLVPKYIAGAYVINTPICMRPKTGYEIQGVKVSI